MFNTDCGTSGSISKRSFSSTTFVTWGFLASATPVEPLSHLLDAPKKRLWHSVNKNEGSKRFIRSHECFQINICTDEPMLGEQQTRAADGALSPIWWSSQALFLSNLPTRIGYCSNANCARRFRCEDNNIAFTQVQPHDYRVWQVEPCHQLGWGSQALFLRMLKQQQLTGCKKFSHGLDFDTNSTQHIEL